jgi:radical SAM superfamily enzyme YgiQ (UPF0313 family)
VVFSGLHCVGCFGCVSWLAYVCWCWRKVQWFLFGFGAAIWIVIVEMEFVLDERGWWYLVLGPHYGSRSI